MLAILPVLIPMFACIAATLASSRPRAQSWIASAGAIGLIAAGVALTWTSHLGVTHRVAFGGWPEPFAIQFAVDRLGAVMILITALSGAACLLHQSAGADAAPRHPLLLPLVFGLLAGVCGAFATADLFNLYVWIEVALMSSVGLLALGGGRAQLDATLKYLVLNLFGTLLLLAGVALIYGATGHLQFGAVARAAQHVEPGVLLPIHAALLLAFMIKAGAFPLFGWLPASYHTLPAPLHALFAALLTKLGAYAILRLHGDVLAAPAALSEILGWVAAVTMAAGVIGAAYHWDIRRILAFHIVSQIGYILLAVAVDTPGARAAALFFTLHNILAKSNLILIGGMVHRLTGSYDLRRTGGLYHVRPWLAVLYLIPALSLVGIPPLFGFWAKWLVLSETIAAGRILWTAAALGVSLLTMYSMVKIWTEAFWKAHPEAGWSPPADARLGAAWAAVTLLAALTLVVGLAPDILIAYTRAAADALGGAR